MSVDSRQDGGTPGPITTAIRPTPNIPAIEGGKPSLCDVHKADRALSRAVPARLACLTHALENAEDWGIWGGLSEGQRWQGKRLG